MVDAQDVGEASKGASAAPPISTSCDRNVKLPDRYNVVVDRSHTTKGGEGAAGHIFGVVKWGLLIRPAKLWLSAKPLHPGIAADSQRFTELPDLRYGLPASHARNDP